MTAAIAIVHSVHLMNANSVSGGCWSLHPYCSA